MQGWTPQQCDCHAREQDYLAFFSHLDLFALFLTPFARAFFTTAFAIPFAIPFPAIFSSGFTFPFPGEVFLSAATVFFFAGTFEAFLAASFVETAFFAAAFTGVFSVRFFFAIPARAGAV